MIHTPTAGGKFKVDPDARRGKILALPVRAASPSIWVRTSHRAPPLLEQDPMMEGALRVEWRLRNANHPEEDKVRGFRRQRAVC